MHYWSIFYKPFRFFFFTENFELFKLETFFSPHFINYWTKHEETKTNVNIQTHQFTHTLIQNVQSLENQGFVDNVQ